MTDLGPLVDGLHPKDANTLSKSGFLVKYRDLFESLPPSGDYLAVLPVVHGGGQAVLAVTRDKLVCRQQFGEDFVVPLRNVHSVRERTGTFDSSPLQLLVETGSGVLEIGVPVKRESMDVFMTALESALSAPAPQSSDTAPSAADELAKFAALRDQGVISDEEFEGKKAQLLS